MKSFMIGLALILAGGIFLITSYAKMGQWVINDVISQEGTIDSMKDQAAKDETAFTVKYEPFIQRRLTVGKIGIILDDDFFLSVAKDTLDRYQDTPLQDQPAYEYFLFNRACMMEDRVKPPNEAYALYKRYAELFPKGPNIQVVNNAITHLVIKYGMQ